MLSFKKKSLWKPPVLVGAGVVLSAMPAFYSTAPNCPSIAHPGLVAQFIAKSLSWMLYLPSIPRSLLINLSYKQRTTVKYCIFYFYFVDSIIIEMIKYTVSFFPLNLWNNVFQSSKPNSMKREWKRKMGPVVLSNWREGISHTEVADPGALCSVCRVRGWWPRQRYVLSWPDGDASEQPLLSCIPFLVHSNTVVNVHDGNEKK